MEKVIYALWRDPHQDKSDFNKRWLEETGPALAAHARSVRLNLQDDAVADGASPRTVSTKPAIEAALQMWVDTAEDTARAPLDEIVGEACQRFSAWLVCEATPIINTAFPAPEGARTPGFSQIVFLGRPPRLSWEAWREAWQRHHTKPAIETQSNFEYQQNLVMRPLTYGAPDYAAIVEECFPIEALNDTSVYFDAKDDPKKLEANVKKMMDSVARFIDHDRMDCFPTSQYDVKKLFC